jgi:hypothetical protein
LAVYLAKCSKLKTTISFLTQEETKRLFSAPFTPDPQKASVNIWWCHAKEKRRRAVP